MTIIEFCLHKTLQNYLPTIFDHLLSNIYKITQLHNYQSDFKQHFQLKKTPKNT